MHTYIEITLKTNSTTRYRFENLDSLCYLEKIFIPVMDVGGVIENITEQDFFDHKNVKYLINITNLGIKTDSYQTVFENIEEEKTYYDAVEQFRNLK